MEMFECSGSWIEALGKTLIHSLWIGILFLSVLKLAYLIIPPRLANRRYRFASSLLLLFTVSVAILFSILYKPAREASVTLTTGLRMINPDYLDFQEENPWQQMIYYICACLYITGLLAYLLHTAASIRSIHSIRRNGKPADGMWQNRFEGFKARAGVGSNTLLLVSERIRTPFLSGIIKPVVIVPAGMLTQLPFSQVESILMHELYHLKRFDHLAIIFQRIVEILFFYNPAARVISGTIRRERENCCDDLVLRECSQLLDYARALYQLAMDQGLPVMVQAASGNSRRHLKTRIQRILNPLTMKTNIHEKLSAILLFAGGLLIVAVISGFIPAFSVTKYSQDPEEVNPMAQPAPEAKPEPFTHPSPVIQPDTTAGSGKALPAEEDIIREEIDWDQIKRDIEAAYDKGWMIVEAFRKIVDDTAQPIFDTVEYDSDEFDETYELTLDTGIINIEAILNETLPDSAHLTKEADIAEDDVA